MVGRLAEDSMNDAVEEVKDSPDTVWWVRNFFFSLVEMRLFVGIL